MNKKGTLLIFTIFLLSFSYAATFERTPQVLTAQTEIVEPYMQIKLQGTTLNFGEIASGYETKYAKVNISNTGTMDVIVRPEIDNLLDPIFQNLYFTHRSPSTDFNYKRIGEFDFRLNKSEEYGEENEDYFYAKLDLRSYSGSAQGALQTDITFWIMPA
jgi:hypothetical protein